MMNRDIYSHLLKWKSSKNRKPLILKGARQVGKTHILNHFGKTEYINVVYFNFEKDPNLGDFFEAKIDTSKILEKLAIYSEKKINRETTLVIFDEIQACPNAIKSLKYFNEENNDYHLAAAGSLLGVKLGRTAFPVGKVNFLTLFPLTFLEFLDGTGSKRLRTYLENLTECEPIEQAFHERLLDELRLYFFIGGMPEAIVTYLEKHDLKDVRKVQNDILTGYESDFSKHVDSAADAHKIAALWASVPGQLARENKKFKYSEIVKKARSRDYTNSLKWLSDAGLIIQAHKITTAQLPLSAYKVEDSFKIYFLDTGLLGAKLKLSAKTIIQGETLFEQFSGAYTENYVAQELIGKGFSDVCYWASPNEAEVDFVVSFAEKIYPLEVKAGGNGKAKSLRVYAAKFKPPAISIATIRNLKRDDDHCNFPLYAINRFPDLVAPKGDMAEQLGLGIVD